MSDNQKQYPRRLSVQVTEAMEDRLDQIARRRDEPKAEVVRTAIRLYLDEQEDVIGSRKHFNKQFGRRMDMLACLFTSSLWVNLEILQMLNKRLRNRTDDLSELLDTAIGAGVASQEDIQTAIDQRIQQQKTKPPA